MSKFFSETEIMSQPFDEEGRTPSQRMHDEIFKDVVSSGSDKSYHPTNSEIESDEEYFANPPPPVKKKAAFTPKPNPQADKSNEPEEDWSDLSGFLLNKGKGKGKGKGKDGVKGGKGGKGKK